MRVTTGFDLASIHRLCRFKNDLSGIALIRPPMIGINRPLRSGVLGLGHGCVFSPFSPPFQVGFSGFGKGSWSAVTFPFEDDSIRRVSESVESSRSEESVRKSVVPFVEVEVACDDGRSSFVSLRYEVVEVLVVRGAIGLSPKSSMMSNGALTKVWNRRS